MAAGDLLNTIGDGGAELGLADLFPASNAAFSSSRSNSVIHQSSPNHLAELLEKAGEGDFLRAVAEAVLQLLMERRRRADRRRALRAQRRADHLAQRLPRPHS